MSTSKWNKRWLYDSKVEIPKTTKWRRNNEFTNPAVGDARQDFSSKTIDGVIDLGNNTSPFKKQRILGDCLANTQTKTLSSSMCVYENNNSMELDSQTAVNTSDLDDASKQTENMQDLLDCKGEDIFNYSFKISPHQSIVY